MLKKQDYNGLAQIAINEYGQAPENQGLDRHAWRGQPFKTLLGSPQETTRARRYSEDASFKTASAMKGIIFTEFLEMVEQRFSARAMEQMIAAAQLPSGGAYTAVGNYDHGEIWRLVCELSKVCDTPVPDLFKAYGEYLFSRLASNYAQLLAAMSGSFDDLQSLDGVIHSEVRRLYADAELPRFDVVERSPSRMVLVYSSKRHFADLAEGLIRGSGRHFKEDIVISREQLPSDDGSRVRFTLTLQ